jgi:AraC-like DNA-binding protein
MLDGAVVDEHMWRVPAARLRPLVSWYAGFQQAGVAPGRHRGLPSPFLTFILMLDDPLVIEAHPDPRQPRASYGTLLGGLHTSPAMITHNGRQFGIQLGLTPLGARALLGMPAGELANRDEDATRVIGGFAAELQERVRARRTWPERFAMLDDLLGRRVADCGALDCPGTLDAGRGGVIRPEMAHAWRRLRGSRGAMPVAELAAETGWSARYLNSAFRAETGLAPKAAARVFRFDHARRRMARTAAAGRNLADLAAECGYYDQAHLAREFRDLAGCPPTQWLAEEFRFVQAMPADLAE